MTLILDEEHNLNIASYQSYKSKIYYSYMYISLENMNCQDIGHCKSNIADRERCASFMLPDHFHDVTYDHIWAKT